MAHEMGDAPCGQVTLQSLTSLQETRQVPRHTTAHVVTLVQATVLPGPTRTPQRSTLRQSYWQLDPQKAPQETVLWQSMWQSAPHDAEQSLTSWHCKLQLSPHTPPQWTML